MSKQIIDSWPHWPTSRGTILSGGDPANPDGWQDNLNLIQELLNGRLQEPASPTDGALLYYKGATGDWAVLAAGTNGQVLTMAAGAPAWGLVTDKQMDYTAIRNNLVFWMLR